MQTGWAYVGGSNADPNTNRHLSADHGAGNRVKIVCRSLSGRLILNSLEPHCRRPQLIKQIRLSADPKKSGGGAEPL